jgi:heme-degrading monooxygenase HmoA
MPFISLTRLRVRSIRFLPQFLLHAFRSRNQVRRAPGFKTGALLADRGLAFWTVTVWDSEESMRQFMISGYHKAAMPHLVEWCDEASVAHWTEADASPQSQPVLPSWQEADRRMRESGRASKVKHPSPNHANLNFRAPRTAAGGIITRY